MQTPPEAIDCRPIGVARESYLACLIEMERPESCPSELEVDQGCSCLGNRDAGTARAPGRECLTQRVHQVIWGAIHI
jgi:hypothetical protein